MASANYNFVFCNNGKYIRLVRFGALEENSILLIYLPVIISFVGYTLLIAAPNCCKRVSIY